MKKILLLLICVLVTGCASAKQYVPFPDQSVSLEDPSKARIYVVRPTSFGAAVKIKLSDGIREIGVTGPNSFLCWETEPKDITLTSKAENSSNLLLNLQAGQIYYVQQHIRMGILYARNWLEELSPEEGQKFVSKAKAPKLENDSSKAVTIA